MDPKTQSVHTVTWNGDNIFVARNVSGIEAKMQGSSKDGLPNTNMSPIDYFISTLGSCPGIEITNVCKDRGIIITGLSSRIDSVRSAALPTIFTAVHVHFILTGNISEQEITGIINEVMTLRCPIAVSFARLTNLTWSKEIIRNT